MRAGGSFDVAARRVSASAASAARRSDVRLLRGQRDCRPSLCRHTPDSGFFGSGAASPYSSMPTGCQSWKVISPSMPRLSTHAEPESCCPPHSRYGKRVVGGHVIHRRGRLVVPVAPRFAAIGRHHAALIAHQQNDIRCCSDSPSSSDNRRRRARRAPPTTSGRHLRSARTPSSSYRPHSRSSDPP